MATKEIIRSINQMSKNKPKSSKKMKQFSSRPLKFQKKTLISCDNYAYIILTATKLSQSAAIAYEYVFFL